PELTHTRFGTLRLKDGICDQLRDTTGSRPDIATDRPAVRVHAHANGPKVTVSLDLAGEGLHRRGYRTEAGEAPLRENLSAGMLLRAGWPEKSAAAAEFLDPMCGSGTLVIEAGMIAARMAPNARRNYFGFIGWLGHDRAAWERVKNAALAREIRPTIPLRGLDTDAGVLDAARGNAKRAGLEGLVQFARGRMNEVRPVADGVGFLATNPPYGVRLDDRDAARALMKELGELLRTHFIGWEAAILAGSPDAGLELGIRAERVHTLWNGALECRLLRLKIAAAAEKQFFHKGGAARIDEALADSPGSKMFGNRLGKNLKQLKSWAEREQVSCYRVYDADMPEYSFAIDRYAEAPSKGKEPRVWLYVQEYAAPRTIEPEAVLRRRSEALAALPSVTGLEPARIHLRQRRKTARGDQYEKLDESGEFQLVAESGLRFWVNFTDYLDTGLFLDHRITRQRLRAAAAGTRFLNLFAYTGSATVYAAAGGARETTTVDMSATYLDWATRNLAVNGFSGGNHEFIQEDCIAWLKDAVAERRRFDLIFLDPPTFSNSKRMDDILDVQRDHADLVHRCMALLAEGGKLVFSNNAQKFKLDTVLSEQYEVKDVTRATIPKDYERNPRIHVCYEITAR
ncbi:MAG TPA: bifunctional 23S rRNA (guanine(2069)-N(7))-methyltransferase RlmK/23S rRNA (guanine(2445)-N(2))-methyltransferase RlmL, partial [Opitutaceae bacterium]|nr:bifunctional 23S rRNA (guanine(2069)-N(7))-methyltransferase RlmK/23S rRNA (guanine(2445)-N(2))-methyltransferase RlmL [Opitutaceae bacterium]